MSDYAEYRSDVVGTDFGFDLWIKGFHYSLETLQLHPFAYY